MRLTEADTFAFIEKAPFAPGKLYLDVGDREGERHVAKALRLRDLLESKGYKLGKDLMWVEEESGAHHESDWGRRFRDALPFLVPDTVVRESDEDEGSRLRGTHSIGE